MKKILVLCIAAVLTIGFVGCPTPLDPSLSLDEGTSPSRSLSGQSAYITEVFDYCYGVGQHAESHPSIHAVPADAQKFIGTNSDYVLLGGWGGYIVAGFDHNVTNASGADFAVYTQPGTGNEQAVVYVMADSNGNGQPDDTWYELTGSATDADYSAGGTYDYPGNPYSPPTTVTYPADPLNKYIRNYELTYYKAAPGGDITWTDNQGNSGTLKSGYWQSYSEKWWWPYYGSGVTSKTFTGVKLPNGKFTPNGTYWWDFQDRLTWGYGENYADYGATDCKQVTFGSGVRKANCLDIANAIDANGNSVSLTEIRFIKVQTGIFQQAGWLNEVSTEVSGAVDLHWPGIVVQN